MFSKVFCNGSASFLRYMTNASHPLVVNCGYNRWRLLYIRLSGNEGSHHVINRGRILYFNTASPNPSLNGIATMNGSEHVENTHVNVVPPSYATKLTPTSSIMANLRKLKANVPNDADYDVSFPLVSVP
ncbi:hypothetical protein Tco_0430904 [Tanacetum coccineum]